MTATVTIKVNYIPDGKELILTQNYKLNPQENSYEQKINVDFDTIIYLHNENNYTIIERDVVNN